MYSKKKFCLETKRNIRHYLSTQQKSIMVNSREKVVLECNPKIMSLVREEIYDINITWTYNGMPFSRIKFVMDENNSLGNKLKFC